MRPSWRSSRSAARGGRGQDGEDLSGQRRANPGLLHSTRPRKSSSGVGGVCPAERKGNKLVARTVQIRPPDPRTASAQHSPPGEGRAPKTVEDSAGGTGGGAGAYTHPEQRRELAEAAPTFAAGGGEGGRTRRLKAVLCGRGPRARVPAEGGVVDGGRRFSEKELPAVGRGGQHAESCCG